MICSYRKILMLGLCSLAISYSSDNPAVYANALDAHRPSSGGGPFERDNDFPVFCNENAVEGVLKFGGKSTSTLDEGKYINGEFQLLVDFQWADEDEFNQAFRGIAALTLVANTELFETRTEASRVFIPGGSSDYSPKPDPGSSEPTERQPIEWPLFSGVKLLEGSNLITFKIPKGNEINKDNWLFRVQFAESIEDYEAGNYLELDESCTVLGPPTVIAGNPPSSKRPTSKFDLSDNSASFSAGGGCSLKNSDGMSNMFFWFALTVFLGLIFGSRRFEERKKLKT